MAKGSTIARKTMARLVAVQMFYRRNFATMTAKSLLAEFKETGPMLDSDVEWVDVDKDLLVTIIQGYEAHQGLVDEMLNARVTPDQAAEPLLGAILRPAIYELLFNTKTDVPIIISEYLSVADSFFEGRETALVNGVLDQVGKLARPKD